MVQDGSAWEGLARIETIAILVERLLGSVSRVEHQLAEYYVCYRSELIAN